MEDRMKKLRGTDLPVAVPRTIDEVRAAERVLSDRLWYDERAWLIAIAQEYEHKCPECSGLAQGAKKAAAMEARHGVENLGPYTEIDLSRMEASLSTLRWVLGDEWDQAR